MRLVLAGELALVYLAACGIAVTPALVALSVMWLVALIVAVAAVVLVDLTVE